MVNIFFNVPEVRNYLLIHGIVYSLRNRRHVGKAVAVQGSLYKHFNLGRVIVERIMNGPTVEDLENYVSQSGFKTVKEWIDCAYKHFKKYGVWNVSELGLYKVTLVEKMEAKK